MKKNISFGIITAVISFIFFLVGCSKNNVQTTNEITTTTKEKKDYSLAVKTVDKSISSQEIIEKNNKQYIKSGSSYTMNLSIVVEKNGKNKDFLEEFTLSLIDKDSVSLDMQIESANSSEIEKEYNIEYSYIRNDIIYSMPSEKDIFTLSVELQFRTNRDIEIEAQFIEIILESSNIEFNIPIQYKNDILPCSNYLLAPLVFSYDKELTGYIIDYTNYKDDITIPNKLFNCSVLDVILGDDKSFSDKCLSQYGNAYYAGSDYNPYMILVKVADKNVAYCGISSNCKYIHRFAFSQCINLTNIFIPEGVAAIGESAFSICDNLKSITIPKNVISIGSSAFSSCSNLSEVIISDGVIDIGTTTFFLCNKLTSITIPKSVTRIGERAFYGCSGLTSIVVDENNKTFDSRNNCNAIIKTATNELLVGCSSTIIPNDITSIGSYAFGGCRSLTKITIPKSVTSIGDAAFYLCDKLTTITIPASVISIGKIAFYYCIKLTTITYSGTKVQWYAIEFGENWSIGIVSCSVNCSG